MDLLRIQLLGEFHLDYNGAPLASVGTERLQSFLAYLLIHRAAPQPRKHIAELLYPDSEIGQALTNLRNLLYSLRKALPKSDRFLAVDGQNLQWRSDAPYSLDVEEFEKAIKSKDSPECLEQAVRLYQGSLLPRSYEEWVLRERERLEREFRAALERLITLLEGRKEYSRALAYCERLRAEDDLREEVYRIMMHLLGLMGDRAAVKRVYQQLVEKLLKELGIQPSPETKQAYEQAMRQNQTAPGGNFPAISSKEFSKPSELPLPVEYRADVVQQIIKVLRSGESCSVVGIAGSGKGNLARHLRRPDVRRHYFGADAARIVVVLINCKPMVSQPSQLLYLTILDKLGESLAELDGAFKPLLRRLRELWEKAVLIPEPLAKRNLDRALTEIIRSGAQQVILIMDECDELFAQAESSLFADLRELRDNHKYRLVYLTLTLRELEFLRPDYTEVEELSDLLSGAGHVIAIPPHSEADSFASLRRLAARQDPPCSLGDAELKQLYEWGGGHSALMRVLFFATRAKVPCQAPDAVEKLAHVPDVEGECQKIWDGLREAERTGLRQLVHSRTVAPETLERLARRGLIRAQPTRAPEFLSPVFERFVAAVKGRPGGGNRNLGFTPRPDD